ncbi:WYL domain-containing protein [Actinobacteria bacterium YIM 96077]|uniref:WYL domain-containing protein n=1 Tax=Phytoactinopolyspora halophila TaxID=1981511 RepID=A0A329R0F1_9ACTN|nr:WYL domain-containing protein [Phytoactinopolyspora halophila]AYY13306.1 WYL domain-containing protein [Actinobacteria bacterium YIM 96077]RAW17459.1 WYL domain-containing protein [Phytoactinopolyspora halophila]
MSNATRRQPRPDSASSQVARLLSMLPYLRSHPYTRVADVAQLFGVSERQVIRDLRVLWFSGLPGLAMGDYIEVDMEAVEGEGTVSVSNADYLARPLRLRTDEAVALIVALRTLRDVPGTFEREAIDRAITKLEHAAGEVAERAAAVQVEVDADAVAEVAATVREALERNRVLHLSYWVPARDETTERDVDPMRLVVVDGRLYLEGWCRRAEAVRLFRLDRVAAIDVLNATADVPGEARPRDLSAGLFQPSPGDELVTLDLTRHGRWVADYYPHESVEELSGGGVRLQLYVRDRPWVRRLALRLGATGRVVDPPDLAAEISAEARAALAGYGVDVQ